MSKSTKNIFYTRNIPLSNSLILNNFSIQNLIISPTKYITNYRAPLITNNYIVRSPYIYSPSPQKYQPMISYIQQPTPKALFQSNLNPLNSNKSAKKLNCYNLKFIKRTPLRTSPSTNNILIKSYEKQPQDTKNIKHTNTKNNIFEKTENKVLKTSASQIIFKTIKNPFGTINNLNASTNLIEPKNLNNFYSKNDENNINLANQTPEQLEPRGIINLNEFKFSDQIGKGSYGKIFCVKWKKNDKLYALKKEILTDKETIKKRKEIYKTIQNYIKKSKNSGVINLYGNLLLKNNIDSEYQYYELMEKAERDWDQEINVRSQYNLYYKESELLNIMNQLVSTLSLLQKNHITHRDIKPQNILIINGKYKLCDFGEIRVLKRNGLIVQRVRGSELYMSPILFKGLHSKLPQVKHNSYKSDVFSLGMCFFFASSMTYAGVDSIRELADISKIKEILFQYLSNRYSEKYILLILLMLEINEEKRPDFIELENKLKEVFVI